MDALSLVVSSSSSLASGALLIGTLLLLVPSTAMGQLGGENLRGDYEIVSATQTCGFLKARRVVANGHQNSNWHCQIAESVT